MAPRSANGGGATRYFNGVSDDIVDTGPRDENPPDFDPQSELAYVRDTPADAILANHFFVLAHWSAVHLAQTPPDLTGAQLVIDTMSAMIEAGGDRLGANAVLYRSAVAEIQQVYVRAAHAHLAAERAPLDDTTDVDGTDLGHQGDASPSDAI
jgi:hypothetical protein